MTSIIPPNKRRPKRGYSRRKPVVLIDNPDLCPNCEKKNSFIQYSACFICTNCDEVVMKEVEDRVNWK